MPSTEVGVQWIARRLVLTQETIYITTLQEDRKRTYSIVVCAAHEDASCIRNGRPGTDVLGAETGVLNEVPMRHVVTIESVDPSLALYSNRRRRSSLSGVCAHAGFVRDAWS